MHVSCEVVFLFQSADMDKEKDNKGNMTLNFEEFVHFYHDICRREEVYRIFTE